MSMRSFTDHTIELLFSDCVENIGVILYYNKTTEQFSCTLRKTCCVLLTDSKNKLFIKKKIK